MAQKVTASTTSMNQPSGFNVGVSPFTLEECRACVRRFACPFTRLTEKYFKSQWPLDDGRSNQSHLGDSIDAELSAARMNYLPFYDANCFNDYNFIEMEIFMNAYAEGELWPH